MHRSLLAEHEVTHLIQRTSATAQRLGIVTPPGSGAEELTQDVAPISVSGKLEETDPAA